METQPTEWEKIFVNHMSLVSRIYKKNSYDSTTERQLKKMGQVLELVFLQQRYTNAPQAHKTPT